MSSPTILQPCRAAVGVTFNRCIKIVMKSDPAKVAGSLHGQFEIALKIFSVNGPLGIRIVSIKTTRRLLLQIFYRLIAQ